MYTPQLTLLPHMIYVNCQVSVLKEWFEMSLSFFSIRVKWLPLIPKPVGSRSCFKAYMVPALVDILKQLLTINRQLDPNIAFLWWLLSHIFQNQFKTSFSHRLISFQVHS